MKIGKAIIQDRFIYEDNGFDFHARYKNHEIYVGYSSSFLHDDNTPRFLIEVIDPNGCLVVDTFGAFKNIDSAIKYALEQSNLIPK